MKCLWKDHKKQNVDSFEGRGVRMLALEWDGGREARNRDSRCQSKNLDFVTWACPFIPLCLSFLTCETKKILLPPVS